MLIINVINIRATETPNRAGVIVIVVESPGIFEHATHVLHRGSRPHVEGLVKHAGTTKHVTLEYEHSLPQSLGARRTVYTYLDFRSRMPSDKLAGLTSTLGA